MDPFSRLFQLITTTVPHNSRGLHVLDVGTKRWPRSGPTIFRTRFAQLGWSYIGLDIEAGDEVDIVTKDPYKYPFPDNSFDVVMSSMTLEHVVKPWLWFPELKRICKTGGVIAISVPWKFKPHNSPDLWRVLPCGLESIYTELGLTNLNTFRDEVYSYGIGRKQ